MKKLSLNNVCSDINGILTWGRVSFGMRQMIITDRDGEVERYCVMRLSEKFENETVIKTGDILGWQGWLPKVIMIGAARVIFPKTLDYNSGESALIEGCFYGEDGKYYLGRMCSLLLLLHGNFYGAKYNLKHETVETGFLHG